MYVYNITDGMTTLPDSGNALFLLTASTISWNELAVRCCVQRGADFMLCWTVARHVHLATAHGQLLVKLEAEDGKQASCEGHTPDHEQKYGRTPVFLFAQEGHGVVIREMSLKPLPT